MPDDLGSGGTFVVGGLGLLMGTLLLRMLLHVGFMLVKRTPSTAVSGIYAFRRYVLFCFLSLFHAFCSVLFCLLSSVFVPRLLFLCTHAEKQW